MGSTKSSTKYHWNDGCFQRRSKYVNIYIYTHTHSWPVPVPTRSKARVCGLLPAGIAGSNPAEGMDICLLWMLFVVRQSLRRANHSSIGVLPSVVCLTECDLKASIMRRPWPTGGCCAMVIHIYIYEQLASGVPREWFGGFKPPPPPQISKFWQSWAEFPVPWKIHLQVFSVPIPSS
jgi:hypothetical protein